MARCIVCMGTGTLADGICPDCEGTGVCYCEACEELEQECVKNEAL